MLKPFTFCVILGIICFMFSVIVSEAERREAKSEREKSGAKMDALITELREFHNDIKSKGGSDDKHADKPK